MNKILTVTVISISIIFLGIAYFFVFGKNTKKYEIHHESYLADPGAEMMDGSVQTFTTETENNLNNISLVTWGKILFSGIFTLAALFVILSKKYDDETKRWAISILSLISGVWIGTVTQ